MTHGIPSGPLQIDISLMQSPWHLKMSECEERQSPFAVSTLRSLGPEAYCYLFIDSFNRDLSCSCYVPSPEFWDTVMNMTDELSDFTNTLWGMIQVNKEINK